MQTLPEGGPTAEGGCAVGDTWNAEQVYEEIRRSRDGREAESERLRELGPDPEQLASYRADLGRTTVSFRRRVGIVGTAVPSSGPAQGPPATGQEGAPNR